MQITTIYIYPIKALRPITLRTSLLGPQGLLHDRRFMLCKVTDAGLQCISLARNPACALFEQELISTYEGRDVDAIRVHCRIPDGDRRDNSLTVPLHPDTAALELQTVQVDLHGSPADVAYGMGETYDAWFSRFFGFAVRLVYLGAGRRPVLGNLAPGAREGGGGSWAETLTSFFRGKTEEAKQWHIAFTDVAPLLITSEASLLAVQRMLDEKARQERPPQAQMYKFRPNFVLDGAGETAWAEDFWAELAVTPSSGVRNPVRLVLTANCGRCASLNVDYETGRPAKGLEGEVLKTLMKDRRVDKGLRYSPVFGRYGFLAGEADGCVRVSVGDEVEVTKRGGERTIFDWPGL